MGIAPSEIDNLTYYEFQLYREGYREKILDQWEQTRWIAHKVLIASGMLKNVPSVQDLLPLPRDKAKVVGKVGTEKWSQKRIKASNEWFTKGVRKLFDGRDGNKRE